MKLRTALVLLSALSLTLGAAAQTSVGTAFTYQGKLTSSGAPYNAAADLEFRLFASATGGSPIATRMLPGTQITHGLFTVDLDFGAAVFTGGQAGWLEIWVNNVRLTGRQRIAPAPYSIYSAYSAATRGIAVDTAGNVGIGTGTPDALLHLGPASQVWTLGGWRKGLRLDGINAIELGGGNNRKYGLGSSQDKLYLFSTLGENAGAAIDYHVMVNETGNVGIGTITPGAQLHVRREQADNENLLELSFAGGNVGSSGEAAALFRATSNSPFRPYMSLKNGEWLIDAGGNLTTGNSMYVGHTGSPGNSGFVSIGQSGGEYGNIGHGFGFSDTPGGHTYRFNDYASRIDFHQGGFRFFAAPQGTTGDPVPWSEVMVIGRNGRIGIGTSNPDATCLLTVDGAACKPGGGMWSNFSDARLKTNVVQLTGTLDRLLGLRGYEFEYTPDARATHAVLPGRQIGLMAQEVEEVFPDWVTRGEDGVLRVTERATTALMVEALRDLRAEKDAQIEALEGEAAQLRARLEAIEARLSRLPESKTVE